MVAIITGNGTGLERSSAFVLGSRGQLGSATLGRAPEDIYVNAANGNLVITRRDEFLIGLGPDIAIDRTYNSQGTVGDGDNNDKWRMGVYRKIIGTAGAATVTRIDWDGSETVYTQVSGNNYINKEGEGAYDTLSYAGSQWTWTDGDTRMADTYDSTGKLTVTADPDGNTITYSYSGALISRVTNSDGAAADEYTDFVYGGTGGTQLLQLTTTAPSGSVRVRYAYDGSNRLSTVTVDLSPSDSSVADGNTYVTNYYYDGSSTRLQAISQQDGSFVSFTYVQVGADYRVASYTQIAAQGVTRTTTFDYSVAGRTIVTDPAGQKTILFVDGSSNLTQITYPADNGYGAPKVVQFTYNGNGDVLTAALGPGDVINYAYDSNGNLTSERDVAGNTVNRTYGSKNELLTETRYLVPDPDGAGASQPGTPVTTRYAYDSENHLRYVVSAEGYVTQYEYNAVGQQTAANEYAGNAYNIAGIAENVSIAEGTLTSWVTGLDKTTARRTETTYNYRGAVATELSYSKMLSNGLFDTSSELSQTTYTYDQTGKLLTRVVNGSAASEVYVYDGLGRMTQATDFNGNVTRTSFLDANGQTVLTHANGLNEVSTYNRAGELIAFSTSSAGGNLVNLVNWPGNPGSVPSGQATVAGWANYSNYTDETRWASTIGPDGLPVVAMEAGQQDVSLEGGGNFTNNMTIDATKAYEFTYLFKLSAMDKHYVFFGLGGFGNAVVENLSDGVDNGNPYFWYAIPGTQDTYLDPDKWYKVVGYVLPQGTPTSSAPLGGVYDVATGQKVLDIYSNYRWNPERSDNTVYSRFFDFYGEANQQYSTYFYHPEVRQVSTATVLGPDAATSLYRYDTLGRLRMTVDATGRRDYMMYDSIGRKIADIDSDGSVTEYRYDANDNLTSTTRYVNKLSGGQIASLVDANGNPTSATFASLRPSANAADQWSFQVYDGANRLVQTIDGTGATTVFTYDGASRITSSKTYANRISAGDIAALKAEATNPNLWANPTDGTSWYVGNLTKTAAGTIDGANATQFSVITTGGWEAFFSGGQYTNAGDVVSLTISMKAVGATTTEQIGLYGYVSAWGDGATLSTAAVLSGPGTLTQAYAGIWTVSGLSTTEATRITITRKMQITEIAEIYFYLKTTDFSQVAAGTSVIAAAPVYQRSRASAIYLPTADAANDRTTRSFYDNDGRVIATLDSLGGLTQSTYDKGGRKIRELRSVTPAAQSHWATGTLAQLIADVGTSASDRRIDYVYDARGFLKYTLDATAHPVEQVYDAAGRVIRIVAYAGSIAPTATYTMAYVASQLTSTGLATNAANRITRSVYDAAGQLVFAIDATGAVSAFTYDNVGQVIKQVRYAMLYTAAGDQTLSTMQSWASGQASNTANRIDRSVYDVAGNLVYSVDAEGYVTEQRYDKAGRATKSIRYPAAYTVSDGVTPQSLAAQIGSLPSGSVVVTYAYDADGLLSDATDGAGAVTHYTYDSFGQRIDTIVAYGTADASTTRLAYDVLGQVVSQTAAYGAAAAATTSYTYDALGNRTSTTDVRSSTSFVYYDALGRQTLAVDAEGFGTQTTYNVFGQVLTVKRLWTRPTGTPTVTTPPTIVTGGGDATTTFAYDNLGRLTAVTDAGSNTESYGYNSFSDRTSVTNKLSAVTTYAFDKMGRLTSEVLPIVAYATDGSSAATSVTNGYTRDTWGSVIAKVEASNIASQARTTTITYDKLGRIVATAHDAVQVVATDLVTVTTVTPTETFTYDSRGNLILSVDAAGARTFTWYDLAGRRVDQVVAVDKDGSGNQIGTLTHWTYDVRGNVKTVRAYRDLVAVPTTAGAAVPSAVNPTYYREMTYAYDASNRLLTSTVASLRTGVYNGSSYVFTTGSVVDETVYYLNKGVTKEIDGNGNATWTWYDRLGRKIAQVDRENFLTVWTLDTNGNATSETRYATKITGAFDQNSAATALPALAGTNAADRTTQFTYDPNGRRLTEKRLGVAIGTVSSGGVLTASTADSTITYTYNALGQALSKTEANGEVTNYGYDTSGRLMWIKSAAFTDNGGATVRPMTETFYDGLGNIVRTETNKEGGAAVDDRVILSTYSNGTAGRRLTSTTDAMGFVHNFEYDIAGRVVKDSYRRYKSDGSYVDEAIAYRYDLAGRARIQAGATKTGATWTFSDATRIGYNGYGEISGKGLTGSPSDTAVYQEVFEYDDGGRLWRTTSGDGTYKIMFYDKAGNVTLALTSLGADLSTYANADAAAAIVTTAGGSSLSTALTTISVLDKRGQQLQSVELDRQLSWNGSSFVTATLKTVRTYNAFGDVTSETDPRGYLSGATAADFRTDFTYNNMGRMTKKESPVTAYTSESGTVVTTERPTELYYYDLSGRLDAITDANGNTSRRLLLAGTGFGESDALVTAEFHADNGVARTYYNVFGDARIIRNELFTGSNATDTDEVYLFDKNGRVTSVSHRGGLLTDTYVYDELGRVIKHWNNYLTSSVVERTDYDLNGRVSSQTDYAGGTMTYSYAWNGTLTTTGFNTFGAWVKTTTNLSSLSSYESLDYFGRTIAKTDFGAHGFAYTYDKGGRLLSMASTGGTGQSITNSWLNTGRLYQLVDAAGTGKNTITAKYGYDAVGNRTYEGYAGTVYSFYFPSGTTSATQTLQNATITYDVMNRIISFIDKDAGGTTRITVTNTYDKNGNVRRVQSSYPNLMFPQYGAMTEDKWFRYDSMNRMVLADGYFDAPTSTIKRGYAGADVTYDLAGRRATQTKDAGLTGYAWQWVWFPGHGPGSGGFEEYMDEGVNGSFQEVPVGYTGQRREEYEYRADGELLNVRFAETGYNDNGDGTVSDNGTFGSAVLRAQYSRDNLGRILQYREFEANGTTVSMDRYSVAYDYRNNITSESNSQKKVESGAVHTYVTHTVNTFSNGLMSSTTADTWRDGSDSAVADTSMSFGYTWYDDAKVATSTYDKDTGSGSNPLWVSTYNYDGIGRAASVDINDDRRRTVSFASTPEGQVLLRKERSTASSNPEDQHFFLNGVQYGEMTNNWYIDRSKTDYATSIVQHGWSANPTPTPFRWNTANGVSFGRFGGAGYDYINSDGNGADSADGRYTVRDGETLQSIAQNTWGDSSLWYLIAQANGLSAGAALIGGQSLILPDRVTNAHNNGSTFKAYDASAALGDLSPTVAKPPKKAKCGMIGMILMVVIAVAVSAITYGALTGPATGILGSIAAGAVSGAAGSIASQAFGVAAGIQSKFDWKGVAMGALTGAVGGGLGKLGALAEAGKLGSKFGVLSQVGRAIGGTGFLSGAARGILTSALTQGIGVATGLKSKFDWAGVAAAGVGGGVSSAIAGALSLEVAVGLTDRYVAQGIASGVSAMAKAATRSLIDGSDFGDNLLASLPDVIGGTIGNLIADKVMASFERTVQRPAKQATEPMLDAVPLGHGPAGPTFHNRIGTAEEKARIGTNAPMEGEAALPTGTRLDRDTLRSVIDQRRRINIGDTERRMIEAQAAYDNHTKASPADLVRLTELRTRFELGMRLENQLIQHFVGTTIDGYTIRGPGYRFANETRAARDAIVLSFAMTRAIGDVHERGGHIDRVDGRYVYDYHVGYRRDDGVPVTRPGFTNTTVAIWHIHPIYGAEYDLNANKTYGAGDAPYGRYVGTQIAAATHGSVPTIQLFLGASDGSFKWMPDSRVNDVVVLHSAGLFDPPTH